MKLIIQIPCYNEEEHLPATLAELPREIEGIDVVEWLVIDDGSTDRTVDVAREGGVDHVIVLEQNQGLARGFMAGLHACIERGADIIINTDADGQYCAKSIPDLIAPILKGEAEFVVGERPIAQRTDFSFTKKILQRLGSAVVRAASNTNIPDAPSGFRAISRKAAMRLNVFNDYTYTLETIIQAGHRGMAITSVPIETNPTERPSRLVRSSASYIKRSIVTIFRIWLLYKPFRFFLALGTPLIVFGLALCIRWLLLNLWLDPEHSRAPSLVVAAIALLSGGQLWIFGLVADLLAANRMLMEDVQLQVRNLQFNRDAKA